jgi:hypothetical protein
MLATERFVKVWVNFGNFKLFSESFRKVISLYKLFTGKLAGFSQGSDNPR